MPPPACGRDRPPGQSRAHATARCRQQCLPSGCAADVARGEEFLVALAAHLGAHLVEAVAGRRADLQQRIDIGAGVDQALEVALADEILLGGGEAEARHEGFLIALESVALLRRAERRAHPVQPVTAPREAQVEDAGVRNRSGYLSPHTSRATSMQSLSFAFSCSTVRLLPWCVLEKPHCGDRHRFSIGTNLDAASMRRLSRSLASSCGTLELTRPSTTRLPFGM